MTPERTRKLLTDWANTPTEYSPAVVRKADQAAAQNSTRPAGAAQVRAQFTEDEKADAGRIDAGIARIIKRYAEVFSSLPSLSPPPDAESRVATCHWDLVARIQPYIRRAWDAPTLRERNWHIFKARHYYHVSTVVWPLFKARMLAADRAGADLRTEIEKPRPEEEMEAEMSPPSLTPFEHVMEHFRRTVHTARHCGNPECPAPYFFARKNQRYCSSKCSASAQREQKREWWRKNRAKLKD